MIANPVILVHGGAGYKPPSKKTLDVLTESLAKGYAILLNGGCSLDAVVAAVTVMENSGMFNAGLGGVLQLDGVQRFDASLMEGTEMKAGAVAGLEGFRNPIQAARRVMDTPHVLMTDLGARRIARGLTRLPRPSKESREKLKKLLRREGRVVRLYRKYFSTVGAVALDLRGSLAAGTSTGGTYAMLPGRVGDSPIIGAGTYAENGSGAVSCTGSGEHILRRSLAKETCLLMVDGTPVPAARAALKALLRIHGQAGLIALDRKGRFAIMHTTAYMASGYAKGMRIQVHQRVRQAR
ncbi:MAG TPA: isoaspartyl peptidase/L-asparaginase family protein [Nitrospirota bacterium]|nr:isoaspartyl peptidase/L-asparaginase family protein [Nitrospirota bacterium]